MKKKLLRIMFIILMMLPVIAFAHFLTFPQETRCILIRFSGLKKEGNIYFKENTGAGKIDALRQLQKTAEKRLIDLWREDAVFDYNIIFCPDKKTYDRYGVPGTPAATHLKMGAYVVLKDESLDSSIIAHEIGHTVLYNRIGWYKTTFKIPTWFNEGLAMQADDRDYYSEDTLHAKKAAGISIPGVSSLKATGFFSGETDAVMLNFLAAKHIVHEWLLTHSLHRFIRRIKTGETFENAYLEND